MKTTLRVLTPPLVGAGDNRALTQSSFTHGNTKTWAFSKVFGFLFLRKKNNKQQNVHKTIYITYIGLLETTSIRIDIIN